MNQTYLDAQAALPFVVEQGRNLESRIYQKRYPNLQFNNVIPIITEGNSWAVGTMFQVVDVTGQAKFISGAANDIPFSGAVRDFGTRDFAMIGAGWEWNIEEINQASLYGININDAKAMGANMGMDILLRSIALSGSAEKNWTGFVNNASVSRVDAAANGTSSSTFWKDKDVDKVAADINDALGSIRDDTNEVEFADTIALPGSALRLLSTRRVGAGDGTMTWLEYIRRNNIYTAENSGAALNIVTLRELETASSDGGGRMVVYRRDPDVVRFHLPMPKRVIGVRQKSLMAYEDGLIARTGGTEIRLPSAMAYIDEITDVPA